MDENKIKLNDKCENFKLCIENSIFIEDLNPLCCVIIQIV